MIIVNNHHNFIVNILIKKCNCCQFHQVPQLVKMIGPEPSKFNGMSPRIDEILGDNPF